MPTPQMPSAPSYCLTLRVERILLLHNVYYKWGGEGGEAESEGGDDNTYNVIIWKVYTVEADVAGPKEGEEEE